MMTKLKAAACVVLFPVAGTAATMDATDLLRQYNLITSDNVVSQQEVEGHAYIGGNLSGNTVQFDFKHADVPDSGLAEVVVLGDNSAMIKGQKGTNGTTVVIEGTNTSFVETANAAYVGTNNGTIQNVDKILTESTGLVPDRSDVIDVLNATAEELAGMASTGTLTKTGQGYVFGSGIYNIDETYFGSGWPYEFTLAPEAGETTIINVAGKSIRLEENFVGTAYETAQSVLWNFYEATELYLDRTIIGSVLAPNAEVSVNASMEGTLFAASALLSGGEVHLQQVSGTIPGGAPAPSPVPLPAALPMLLAAFGGLAFLRRRSA